MEDVTTISEELWSQHRSSTEDEKERRSKLDFLAAKEIVGLIEQLGMKKSMLARSNTECAKVLRLFTDFKALQAGSLKENSRNIYENGNQRERSSHDEGNQHSQHSQSTETTRPAALQSYPSLGACNIESTDLDSFPTFHQTATPTANQTSSSVPGLPPPSPEHNALDVRIEAANIGQCYRAPTDVLLGSNADRVQLSQQQGQC